MYISGVFTGNDLCMILCVHAFVVRSWQKINHIHHTLLFEIAGLKDVACWEIVLLRSAKVVMLRVDGEVSALVLV